MLARHPIVGYEGLPADHPRTEGHSEHIHNLLLPPLTAAAAGYYHRATVVIFQKRCQQGCHAAVAAAAAVSTGTLAIFSHNVLCDRIKSNCGRVVKA